MLQIDTWQRVLILLTLAVGLILAAPNLAYNTVEAHNDAVAEIERAGSNAELEEARAGWPEFLPSNLVNLGLDLRGGAHLLAEVEVEDVYPSRMDGYWTQVRDALRDERSTVGTIRRQPSDPTELRVRISQPEGMSSALAAVRALAQPVVSITASVGATDIVVSGEGDTLIVALSEDEKRATTDRTVQQALEVVRRRIDAAGTREPTIQRQGERRILIQVPGVDSAQEVKDLIGRPARLTFHPVVSIAGSAEQSVGPREFVLPEITQGDQPPSTYWVLERTEVLSGDDLTDAQPAFDQNGQPAVSFQFNPAGARVFCEFTSENVGQPFASVLDGEVVTAPTIQEPICGGSGQITGNFSVAESTDLAVLLRAGSLPASMTFLEERTIGPELGQDSIDAGRLACLFAFAAVLVFMALSYGTFGLFANVALILNIAMIFGLLSLIGATLTLPGIAGIVLTIGMAVDANVLVFERIREELKTTKGPARAIELGYEKALSAIIDANITTFITAAILFAAGSGPVRGFAVTLGLGIMTSVFTAIFVTRLLIVIWFEMRRPKAIEV